MKKAIIMSISFILVLLASLFILNAMETKEYIRDNSDTANEGSCCSSEMESDELSDYSLFQIDCEWESESGKTVTLKSFEGKQTVMAMIFANCTYACPIIVNDMKNIERSLTDKERNNINFLLISIDPERDTPEALTQFAERFELNLDRWTLITSNKNNVDELSAALGFKYKKENDGSFSHSNIINIIDSNGEVLKQNFGLNQDISSITNELKKHI